MIFQKPKVILMKGTIEREPIKRLQWYQLLLVVDKSLFNFNKNR